MKILIGTISLSSLGGTETWTKTIYDELSKNHDVSVFSPKGYKAYPKLKVARKSDSYDVAFINHKTTYKALRDFKIKKRVIVIHGVIPREEKPRDGADAYVAVSKEIADKYKHLKPTVIKNPIDTNKFKLTVPVNEQLKNVLFISNYRGKPEGMLKKICKENNLNFKRVGGKHHFTKDVVSEMNWADMVIGLGRSAYEGMACERNVIVFDYNGADGIATPETLVEFRKHNCSGRRYKLDWDIQELWEQMQQYDPERGEALREYIIENNSVEKITKQLLSV